MNLTPIPGFPGYFATEDGGIYTERKNGSSGGVREIPKRMKPTIDKDGYETISLRFNGKYKFRRLHRLILQAFRGSPKPRQEGCHNDGNKRNNHISNLRWDSHLNNKHDRYKHGTYFRKITPEKISELRRRFDAGESLKLLHKEYEISYSYAKDLNRGRYPRYNQ